METPPPYRPQKKSNSGLIIGLIIAGVLICCIIPAGGLVGLGLWGYNVVKGPAECALGFEDARDAILAYAKANNDTLPKAETWQDDIRPFFEDVQKKMREDRGPFKSFESTGDWGCVYDKTKRTGVAFNLELSGKKLSEITDKSTPLIFEIESARRNAAERYKADRGTEAPKIMGERRDWIVAPIEGQVDFDMKGERSRVRVDIDDPK